MAMPGSSIQLLHEIIAAVAPIMGVSIGDPADKATWRVDFDPAATIEQRNAAKALLVGYDITSLPIPAISKAQCLLWLLTINKTEADIDALIAAIPDAGNRAVAQIVWKHREPFHRSHPLFNQIGADLGLSPSQIDDAFRAAALL